jgi:hypothetical protein
LEKEYTSPAASSIRSPDSTSHEISPNVASPPWAERI